MNIYAGHNDSRRVALRSASHSLARRLNDHGSLFDLIQSEFSRHNASQQPPEKR
jgi:hypothetical protein